MERAQWLEERRRGIGGSDAPVVAGLRPFGKTALQLYYEKRGEIEPEDISDLERIRFGNRMEQVIADEYVERTGRKVRRVNRILQDKDHPFMLANIDRDVVGERRGLEAKNVGEWAYKNGEWGEDGTDEVPESYLLQCQHYMAVTGYDIWDLAAAVGGNRMLIYEIPRDDELINSLIEIEGDFWEKVQKGVPPPIEYEAAGTMDLIKRRYPGTNGQIITLPERAIALHDLLTGAKMIEKQAKTDQDAYKAELLDMIGENALGVLPDGSGAYVRSERAETEVRYTRKPYVDFRFTKKTTL